MAFQIPYRQLASQFRAAAEGNKWYGLGSLVDRNFAEIEKTLASPGSGFGIVQPVSAGAPEGWHYVGDPGEPAFTANVRNFSAGTASTDFAHVSFYKDPNGWVHVRGLAQRDAGAGIDMFTLPVGYRPAFEVEFCSLSNDAFARTNVLTTGEVRAGVTTAPPSWHSLFGISFYAGNVGTTTQDTLDALRPIRFFGRNAESYASDFSRGALVAVRSDGLLHGMGYVTANVAAPVGIGAAPFDWGPRRRNLHGISQYNGSATQLSRIDTYPGGWIELTAGSSAAGNAASVGGIHAWDQIAEAGWADLSLVNGWVNYNTAQFAPGRYRNDIYGHVWVEGLIKNGTMTSGTVLCTLPVGSRPTNRHIFHSYANGVLQRVDVLADGTVIVGSAAAWTQNAFNTLTNIQFRT